MQAALSWLASAGATNIASMLARNPELNNRLANYFSKGNTLRSQDLSRKDLSAYYVDYKTGQPSENMNHTNFIDCDLTDAYFERPINLTEEGKTPTEFRRCNVTNTIFLLAHINGQYGEAVRKYVTDTHVRENKNTIDTKDYANSFYTLNDISDYLEKNVHNKAIPTALNIEHAGEVFHKQQLTENDKLFLRVFRLIYAGEKAIDQTRQLPVEVERFRAITHKIGKTCSALVRFAAVNEYTDVHSVLSTGTRVLGQAAPIRPTSPAVQSGHTLPPSPRTLHHLIRRNSWSGALVQADGAGAGLSDSQKLRQSRDGDGDTEKKKGGTELSGSQDGSKSAAGIVDGKKGSDLSDDDGTSKGKHQRNEDQRRQNDAGSKSGSKKQGSKKR